MPPLSDDFYQKLEMGPAVLTLAPPPSAGGNDKGHGGNTDKFYATQYKCAACGTTISGHISYVEHCRGKAHVRTAGHIGFAGLLPNDAGFIPPLPAHIAEQIGAQPGPQENAAIVGRPPPPMLPPPPAPAPPANSSSNPAAPAAGGAGVSGEGWWPPAPFCVLRGPAVAAAFAKRRQGGAAALALPPALPPALGGVGWRAKGAGGRDHDCPCDTASAVTAISSRSCSSNAVTNAPRACEKATSRRLRARHGCCPVDA